MKNQSRHALKAIITKYIGPTNHRGARVKASVEGCDSLTVDWQHDLDIFENHELAARRLHEKLGWNEFNELIAGSIATGYVFVQISRGE